MQKKNNAKLEEIAAAHNTHADFDGVLAYYTGQLIAPQVKGKSVIECGCSTGVMTEMLLEYAAEVDVVEGSEIYAQATASKFEGKLRMFVSLFDDFHPEKKYDAVIFAGVLHHLDHPVKTLQHITSWLKPGGEIFISVPNMTAFHRRLGVAMNLNTSVFDTSDRNTFFAQPGRFDKIKLNQVVEEAGFEIVESTGFFFKPFPHDIMNQLNLELPILNGLFKMGLEFPDLACQLFVKAKWNPQTH